MTGSSGHPLHALTFDIEDWFHMLEVDGLDDPSRWGDMESLVESRTEQILGVLRSHSVRATFFILGWIAERHPALVRRIADDGHEIGSHSFWHRAVYSMDPEEFRRDTLDSIRAIESACGTRPLGYRAPSFSILKGCEWAFDILLECGFAWDASLFPAMRGHGGYPCGDGPHLARSASGAAIPELPLSLMRVFGAGVCFSGGGYMRLSPKAVIDAGFRQMERRGIASVVYLHPRDFAPDCPRVAMPLHRRFKCYVGLDTTAGKLEHLLRTRRFGTCGDVLRNAGFLGPAEGAQT
ncbi:MAG: hypothetical protein RLZZ238_791 [Planctomycetota bacterium]|jgi:polysaccharide deacetylase family protein (PEP-CTERM system associated)